MKPFNRNAILLTLALMAVGNHREAFGQRRKAQGPSYPQPYLQSVYPSGVRAGGSAEVILRGNDLEGITALWFDHPGLKAEVIKDLNFRIIASSGTPLGHHDIRVLGTYGVSNPRTFVVGDRNECKEVEPNNTPAKATIVSMNSVVNGEIAGATDVDCFRFEGKKGLRVLLDLEAERIDSRLDATIRLLDAKGREIGESRDAIGVDPFLDVTLPESGNYVVKIHDVTYRGQSDWTYRLTVTDGPHIDAVVPHVLKAGETTEVTLYGRNFRGEVVKETGFDGRPIEKKVVTVTAPSVTEHEPNATGRGLVSSIAALRRGFDHLEYSPSGSSNPVFLSLTTDPVVVEVEPNDDAEHPQIVTLPCDISGIFGKPGDLDIYRFKAKKGESWVFDVGAERIGSPADPVLTLQKVAEKGNPQDVASGEDTADRTGQNRFNTATVDATLHWTASEDGTYQLVVNDLYSPQRGDVRLSYRLQIRSEHPDFRLVVLPESPNLPDALTLSAGGRSVAFVIALREDGFNNAIRVEAAELPAGVKCEPIMIPAGQAMSAIVFEAAPDAKPIVGMVRMIGRARFGDRKEDLGYISGASALGPDLAHSALGATVIWPGPDPLPQPQQQQQGPPPVTRLTRGIVLKIVDALPLALDVKPLRQTITPGSLVSFDLAVSRREPFTEAVTVTPVSLFTTIPNPPPNATVAKGQSAGTFSFRLPLTQAPGIYNVVLQGTGPLPFSKDPKAKTKPNVPLNMPSNPVTLIVRPAPLGLVIKPVTGGFKLGSKVEVEVIVTRRDGGTDAVPVALMAPASLKLKAEPIFAEPGKSTKMTIAIAADSPIGPAEGLALKASVLVRGEPVDVNEPLTVTIAK